MGFGNDKTGFYKPSAVTVTASGNPLTLQSAKRLRQLTIYGNAVQDGTPSPDAPVEVQLCGDKTGNLWDRAYSDVDANWVGNLGGYRYLNLKLKENTTYTLFVKQNNMHHGYSDYWDSDDNVVVFCVGENPNPNTCNGNTVFGSTTTNNPKQVYSFTTTEAPYYFKLFIRNYNDITVKQVFDELLPGIMLVEGSYTADTLPAYEPYGYKVSGRAEGLNLLSSAWEDGNIDINTGNCNEYGMRIRTADYIKCKPNTVYTFYTPYSVIGVRGYDADKTYVSFFPNTVTSSTLTFTTRENVEYLKFITQSSDGTRPDKTLPYMLVQGSYTAETMPPYEPYQPPQDFAVYLPEQIAKVGRVADEVVVDMENRIAILHRNVASIKTDCVSVVSLNEDGNTLNCRNSRLDSGLYQSAEHTEMLNKYFPYIPNSSVDTEGVGPNMSGAMYQTYVRINKSRIDTTEEDTLQTLADKCQAFLDTLDNPKTYYVLDTPVTTDITSLQQWEAMPQVSGTVTLTLSAEVGPGGAEAVYTASKRPKPQAALIEENTITEEPAETQGSDTDINTEIIIMED